MNSVTARREFIRWVNRLESLSVIDKKLLRLILDNFDDLSSLGTAGGRRARRLGQLIEKERDRVSAELSWKYDATKTTSMRAQRITKLEVGPFRGFSRPEVFTFDKKYTFMYGQNGSGKTSFCEALEYALLGSITEAEAKRIDVKDYIKNVHSDKAIKPRLYTSNEDNVEALVSADADAYRFGFVEKNRIDNFARISAQTPNNQRDRLARLFGLEAFSEFVDGFTDNFNDDKYITLQNKEKNTFEEQNKDIVRLQKRIEEVAGKFKELEQREQTLIQKVSQPEITNVKTLRAFLVGEEGTGGQLHVIQRRQAANIPENFSVDVVENIHNVIREIENKLAFLSKKLQTLQTSATDLNFKDLYSAIQSMVSDSKVDKSICPACKTPIDKVTLNPFESAELKLSRLGELSALQSSIEEEAMSIFKKVSQQNKEIGTLNTFIQGNLDSIPSVIPTLTEFHFTGLETLYNIIDELGAGVEEVKNWFISHSKIIREIQEYNTALELQRRKQEESAVELSQLQQFKEELDKIEGLREELVNDQASAEANVETFLSAHDDRLKKIKEIDDRISSNKKFVTSYQSLVRRLKEYRDELPSHLAAGLANRAKQFYNVINSHDSAFEMIDALRLPVRAGERILVRFNGDDTEYDALLILSEGHIKILGLSLLLSKAVEENLRFLIFDDIVNAIDDEHRDGVAELLLKNDQLKDRQHMITCHGELFVRKLEEKLGASGVAKYVKHYRFSSPEVFEERGIRISIGTPRHYLLLAKRALEDEAHKDVAARCRQGIEALCDTLWSKLAKKINVNLTVQMRRPGLRPDLSSVVDSLVRELKKVSNLNELQSDLELLKQRYNWLLLNKGIHVQEEMPEFERKDAVVLYETVEHLEIKVNELSLEVVNVV